MNLKIKYIIVIILMSSTITTKAQKLKNKAFYFPYIACPTDTSKINRDYVWSVADRNIDNFGRTHFFLATSKSADYSRKSGFYNQIMDKIPQFNCKKNWMNNNQKYDIYTPNNKGCFTYIDTINNDTVIYGLIGKHSNIKVELQPLNVVKKKINNKKRLSREANSPLALSYDITFTLDRSFVFYEKNNIEKIRNEDINRKTSFKYNFPRDYKNKNMVIPLGYATNAQLESSYLKYREEFQNQVKELIVKKWIRESLGMVVSRYSESKKTFSPTLFYIKDKKERYESLTLAFEKMRQIEDLIEANYKLKNKSNWHTSEITELALECEKIWGEAIADENKIDGPGKGGKLNEEQYYGITKNLLWSRFILNKHDEVISEIKKLKELNTKSIKKLFLTSFLSMAIDYKKRFDINAKKYNWIN